jgi:hypothetical protein
MSATTRLSVPAEPAYAAVVRTVAMTLAAQAELTGERVQDARLLVDEVFHALLAIAELPTDVGYTFEIDGPRLVVEARVTCAVGAALATDSIQWRVLSALTSEITSHRRDQHLVVAATVGNHD